MNNPSLVVTDDDDDAHADRDQSGAWPENLAISLNRSTPAVVGSIVTAIAPAQLCRLVVQGPERQISVSVPSHVLVTDLLPALLHHLDEKLSDTGLDHGGWVLQRLGDPPFDESGSIASLGLRDGETVYLRPRSDQIPPVHFDDLADGIASGMRDRFGVWRPEMIRGSAAALLAVLLATGVGTLALPGPPLPRTVSALILALLGLAGGLALTRAAGDRAFGMVSTLAGVAYAALAGYVAPGLAGGDPAPGGPEVFAAAVAGVVTAVLAAALVGWARPLFAAIVAGGSVLAVGALPSVVAGIGGTGAIVVVLATVVTVGVPITGFRLARIRMAPLPTRPEHLQEEIDPEPSEALLARAAVADRYMTALHAGIAIACTGGLAVVLSQGGWAAMTLVALVAAARLLALRPMTGLWHRLALSVPAVLGLAGLLLVEGAAAAPLWRWALPPAVLPCGALLLFALARMLPDRRVSPWWGRIGDVAHLVVTIATLPVLFALLGLYDAARAWGG